MASTYWSRYWRQQRSSRRTFIGATGSIGAGAAGLALVGCGGDDDDDSNGNGADPTATTGGDGETPMDGETPGESPTAGNGDESRVGGTIRYPLEGFSSGDPPTLFPFENLTYLAQHPAHLHYSRLLRAVAGPDVASSDFTTLTGDICDGLPEQPDELTYTFKIKPNVFFHDKPPMDGRQATMEDFAQTYEAFLTVSPNAGKYESVIASIEAIDAETLQVTLNEPFAPFLTTHASSSEGCWFIPVEAITGGQVQTDPVGTGPWIFEEWEPGVAMRWNRFAEFFDSPEPNFERVEASLSADPQRILASLEQGDFDWSTLSGTVYNEAESRLDPEGTHFFVPAGVTGGFWFNFDNDGGRWRDVRLRQALSMAMNRDGYLETLDQTGQGDWQSHLSPALLPYFISPRDEATFGENARFFQYRPDEARALIQEATGEDSITLKVTANVDRYGSGAQASWELFTSQIADAGFNVELVYQDYASYIATTYVGDIPEGIALGPLVGAPVDPNDVFATTYESNSARHNWGGTAPDEMAELDMMFAEQRRILDLDERIAYIGDIQRRMAELMIMVPYTGGAGYGYIQPWMLNMYYKNGYSSHRDSVAQAYFTPERLARG